MQSFVVTARAEGNPDFTRLLDAANEDKARDAIMRVYPYPLRGKLVTFACLESDDVDFDEESERNAEASYGGIPAAPSFERRIADEAGENADEAVAMARDFLDNNPDCAF